MGGDHQSWLRILLKNKEATRGRMLLAARVRGNIFVWGVLLSARNKLEKTIYIYKYILLIFLAGKICLRINININIEKNIVWSRKLCGKKEAKQDTIYQLPTHHSRYVYFLIPLAGKWRRNAKKKS